MYSEAKLAFIVYLWYPKTKVRYSLLGSGNISYSLCLEAYLCWMIAGDNICL